MKVVYIVDSVKNLKQNIDKLTMRFGNDMIFIVKSNIYPIVKTYGITANAIYSKNLPTIIGTLLINADLTNVVVCYSSLKLTNELLNNFIQYIGDGSKVVNLMPKYNFFEKMCFSAYNVYVKALFGLKDKMVSPKLQYLPKELVFELLNTHFGNRMFEMDENVCKTIYNTDEEVNKTAKVCTSFNKNYLIPIIFALVLTALFLISLNFFGARFLLILLFVVLYVLDIILTIIFQCKAFFDERFFK